MIARVNWYAQPINPYSLGLRSGVGTIDAIATLIHTTAPITAIIRECKSRSATIFLYLKKTLNLFQKKFNQLLQMNLGSKVQMIAYADDLAINGGPIGGDILYKQMTTALKKIETKAMQLGLKFCPDK